MHIVFVSTLGLPTLLAQGSKVFLVAPPLPTNLAAFESWARSKRQGRTWLGALLSGVTQVTLKAGDTLLLPPGK